MSLANLWRIGSWKALSNLLAINLIHIWSPSHDLWNAPGYKSRFEEVRGRSVGPEPLDATDQDLVDICAAAFGVLRPFSSKDGRRGGGYFLCMGGTIAFNPLHRDEDAERLAKHLHAFVEVKGGVAIASIGGRAAIVTSEWVSDHGGDERAAARRALVTSAAKFLREEMPRAQ